MRAIKRYFAQWGIKQSEYYRTKLNKAIADYQNLDANLRCEIFHKTRRIQFLNSRIDTLTKELNDMKRAAEQNKEVALYFRDKMQEADSTVLIFKYSIDEFLKRHPEFKAEFDEIIKKESESEDEDED